MEDPPAEELRNRLRRRTKRDWEAAAILIALATAWSIYYMQRVQTQRGVVFVVWLAVCTLVLAVAWRGHIRRRIEVSRGDDEGLRERYMRQLDVEIEAFRRRATSRGLGEIGIGFVVMLALLWWRQRDGNWPSLAATACMCATIALAQAIQWWRIRTELPELERESGELGATAPAP